MSDTHHDHVVGGQIPEADIVTLDHENVRALHRQRGATEYRARERDDLDKTTQHNAPWDSCRYRMERKPTRTRVAWRCGQQSDKKLIVRALEGKSP